MSIIVIAKTTKKGVMKMVIAYKKNPISYAASKKCKELMSFSQEQEEIEDETE
jgi:hypothetical protein